MYFWLRQLQGSMESTEGKKEEHTPKRRSGGGGKNSHGSMNQGNQPSVPISQATKTSSVNGQYVSFCSDLVTLKLKYKACLVTLLAP